MCRLLRFPLVLLAVLGLAFLWTSPATADDAAGPVDVVDDLPAEEPAPEEPVGQEPPPEPVPGTDDSAAARACTYGSGASGPWGRSAGA